METVAFLGLGLMGQGMALRLLEGGYSLRVYNRTQDKAQPVVQKGAEFLEDPLAAVRSSTVLITMLSDDDAVKVVVDDQVLEELGQGNIHISMSTISPAAAQDLARQHEDPPGVALHARPGPDPRDGLRPLRHGRRKAAVPRRRRHAAV